jgi:hypothetical protein
MLESNAAEFEILPPDSSRGSQELMAILQALDSATGPASLENDAGWQAASFEQSLASCGGQRHELGTDAGQDRWRGLSYRTMPGHRRGEKVHGL